MKKPFATAGLLLCAALPVSAQSGAGTISGTITHPLDAVIPGAEVTIRNIATNSVFRAISNESGNYTAPGLGVGEAASRAGIL